MNDLTVEIEQGKLQGKTGVDYNERTYYSFQGIPYAQPPIGELRFKPPLPAGPWEGVRDATEVGKVSLTDYKGEYRGTEDCLYLNVYTPSLPICGVVRYPVMVWIHGGGFISGSGGADKFGPQFLITENVVIVTLNYRLGLLGFLKLEDPALGVPGNAGLKDMVLALKWIQKNITSFNGDKNNVTVFGKSAGGCASHYILLSPLTKGLFHRSIVQSGCALNPWSVCISPVFEVADKLDYTGPRTERDILTFLQSIPDKQFLDVQKKLNDSILPDAIRPVGPVIERPSPDAFISEHPIDMIISEKYNKVPLMIGYTDREGMLTEIVHKAKYGEVRIPTDYTTRIPSNINVPKNTELSMKIENMIKKFYFKNSIPTLENLDSLYVLDTDATIWRGLYLSVMTQLLADSPSIYLYRLSLDTKLNLAKIGNGITNPGCCHADDIGYLFKAISTPTFERDSLEGKSVYRMVKLWTNFAKYGDPNPPVKDPLINVIWEPAEIELLKSLQIDKELTFGPNPDLGRMVFWDRISDVCLFQQKTDVYMNTKPNSLRNTI